MHQVVTYARRRLSGEVGLTTSEWAILLALLVVAVVVGVRLVGVNVVILYRFLTGAPL